MAKYLSVTSISILYFMCFTNLEYVSCLLFHGHVNSTQTDNSLVSTDSSTIHHLLDKQMSSLEKSVQLLTEKVSRLEKNRSDADTEMAGLRQKLKATEQKNTDLAQKIILLENLCNHTSNNNQNSNILEERLKKIESDVTNTVILTRTLAVNGEKYRNRTLITEQNLSTLKDELRSVNLFLMEASTKSEELNSSLEWQINSTTLRIQKIIDENKNTNKTINQMVSEVRQGHLLSQKLENSVNKLESNVLDIQNHVGFTAGATISNSWNGRTLVFNKLIYSNGGGYDTSTGVFTSPVIGMFVFYITVVSQSDNDLYLEIVLNGVNKVRTMSWYPSSQIHVYQTGTNVAFLQLQIADRVWIQKSSGGTYYTESAPLVTFTGFRL